jgi:hypothetical protein
MGHIAAVEKSQLDCKSLSKLPSVHTYTEHDLPCKGHFLRPLCLLKDAFPLVSENQG